MREPKPYNAYIDRILPFDDYGCEINRIPVSDLFDSYFLNGFIYPKKMERLAPFMSTVESNWERLLDLGEEAIQIFTHRDAETGLATITRFRSTASGWVAQHLVSNHAIGSGVVMLAAQARNLSQEPFASNQHWFRASNRYANRIFGSITETIDPSHADVSEYHLVLAPKDLSGVGTRTSPSTPLRNLFTIVPIDEPSPDLKRLVLRVRGPVYFQAEELGGPDLELAFLNRLFGTVGLFRYRRVWLAYARQSNHVVGAAIVYRGPLGMNFSMLENRCDLIIAPELDSWERAGLSQDFLDAILPEYGSFEPGFAPVVTDGETARCLVHLGGEMIRRYKQGIWLRPGFEGWYRHVAGFYRRVFSRL
uniref:Uncharacterized protein n=1 Tax=Candidatus Kentrum sp. FM TaxID=2126340 RepID=A0A450STT5_9GAMM|nr:MAG: hypothetical protein BECKFM1743A_GA0114220_101883 [Candidatus Kentron sp. FM]VFJ58027.1 MAG: hypothetical protein BECKFM1743C_GA0114222_102146 [Candidatus Kentron sp. FM]VFK11830.1 MAG: hypothetical protein BECKFM1743B_GA0114221_102096 [Candidatus Kentron sp. FM]